MKKKTARDYDSSFEDGNDTEEKVVKDKRNCEGCGRRLRDHEEYLCERCQIDEEK